MEISGLNIGASTYAMKKAMDMPNNLISVVEQSGDSGNQPIAMKSPSAAHQLDLAAVTGKGNYINIVA